MENSDPWLKHGHPERFIVNGRWSESFAELLADSLRKYACFNIWNDRKDLICAIRRFEVL
jgi:tRNA G46 methylase TrmB